MRTASLAVKAPGSLAPLNWMFGCGGVVAYHDVTRAPFSPSIHVSVRAFTEQLEFLTAERYEILPLSELVERRRQRRSIRRCVALTFDDAYHGVLELALPVLERFAAPATVFVAADYARDPAARYWWDRLTWVLERAHPDVVARRLGTGPLAGKSQDELRTTLVASSAGRLTRSADAALAALERDVGVVPERSLTEAELQVLARGNLIEFGCHTDTHPALPALPVEAQRREIASSYSWLAERLPRVRRFLAYPYGQYDRRAMQAARDAGMEAAFSIEGRAAGPRFDLYACPRIGMAEVNSLRSFELRLSWLAIPLVALRNGGWHPRVAFAS